MLTNEMIEFFNCRLLHEKTPYWDGSYRYDETEEAYVPDVKYVCYECREHKKDASDGK